MGRLRCLASWSGEMSVRVLCTDLGSRWVVTNELSLEAGLRSEGLLTVVWFH